MMGTFTNRAASSFGAGLDFRADKHHSFALVGRQEDDARRFERPTDLIFRRFVDGAMTGFEALQRRERNKGPVSKRFLRPSQQRASGPRLSGGDHA